MKTKTVTISSYYGDTYRKTVYNNWKRDNTVRQGDYGYGDCVGYWFFGDQFTKYLNKNITSIKVKIKRQSGGLNKEIVHGLRMHSYLERTDELPKFNDNFIEFFELRPDETIIIPLAKDGISKFKTCKGFGLSPLAQNNSVYSVCSGKMSVEITYTEKFNIFNFFKNRKKDATHGR